MSFESFQVRVDEWLRACFSADICKNKAERTHRFLEESIELAQANGCSIEDAKALVEYVYGRPKGRPELEVGGVLVTLAGVCVATHIDMENAGELELTRNWTRIEVIREKRAVAPVGSPLPE